MRGRTPLAEATAHLSELVDHAEHEKKRILILRHGKPAAAIVPVEVAAPTWRKAKSMTDEDVRALFEDAARCGDPGFLAVDDLLRERRWGTCSTRRSPSRRCDGTSPSTPHRSRTSRRVA